MRHDWIIGRIAFLLRSTRYAESNQRVDEEAYYLGGFLAGLLTAEVLTESQFDRLAKLKNNAARYRRSELLSAEVERLLGRAA